MHDTPAGRLASMFAFLYEFDGARKYRAFICGVELRIDLCGLVHDREEIFKHCESYMEQIDRLTSLLRVLCAA